MPCRINLSRIFRASNGANGSLPCLPWAWPAFWTKGPKSLRTLATQALILVSRYVERFKSHQWPKGSRLPTVYYDPRSVSDDTPIRSSLHAKCVVVDECDVFVSSANFTEAGQERNIEVGLRLDNSWLARKLVEHFKRMAETGQFRRAL
jgi:phosphatidylserine/phosphatidylglycerophosphate/cardiolipin synthase-like enzyme